MSGFSYGYDLIVWDAELEASSAAVSAFEKDLGETLSDYKIALDDLATNGIASGSAHEALLLYSDYVEKVCKLVTEIQKKYHQLESDYISEIDRHDDYLYDGGKRDFSVAEYENLVSCLDDPWCELTDNIGDWLMRKPSGLVKQMGKIPGMGVVIKVLGFTLSVVMDGVSDALKKNKKVLLDLNNTTQQILDDIFLRVFTTDASYGQGDGLKSFGYFVTFYQKLTKLLEEMANVIAPNSGYFTPDGIRMRFGKLYADLVKSYDGAMAIPTSDMVITIDEIETFAGMTWASSCFAQLFWPCSSFANEHLGIGDVLLTTLFNMFDISRTQIRNSLMAKIAGENPGLATYSYEDYLVKEALMMQLQSMSKEEAYKDSTYHELLSEMKDALKETHDSGEALYKYLNTTRQNWESTKKSSFQEGGSLLLDGRTKEAKEYKGFLKSLDSAEKILKYGDQGLEYVAELLANYDKGLEMIDSLKRTYIGDKTVQKAINEIEALYKKDASAWVEKGLDIVVKDGLEVAEKELLKDAGPVGVVISTIEKTIDTTGEVTGLKDKTKGMIEYTSQLSLYTTQSTAYNVALEKLRTADPNSDEYEILAKDVKNCYEMTKRSMKGMYDAMAKATSGDEAAYYKYCAKEISEMSMRDTEPTKLMTFEQFIAGN